jgi:hypothetical protein
MSGGSVEPEGARSQQCDHCKLFFSPQGISNHETHCNWKDVDVREFAARVLSDAENDGSGVEDDMSPSHEAEPADGEAPGTSDEDDPATGADAARADGAGLGLDGPPEPPADDGGDADEGGDDRDGLACIECGEPLDVTEEELRDRFGSGAAKLTCECGKTMRWSA